nr:hypothetical protein [Methyloligella halotolerans]
MYGDEGMDILEGGDGDDELHGGADNDTLEGGAGVDTLYGEEGADRFVFRSASDADGDVIEDFETGDRIDLSFIDADAGTGGDQAFTLVTGSGFNAAGALRVTQETRDGVDYTVVEGNIDGGTDAEFKIDIKGHHDLNSNDFNL